MKRLKQVVVGLVWCAVSVGCVAEETKQPAVSEVPAMSPAAVVKQDAKPSGNDEITITTHIDQKTGEEYQEIKATYVVDKINYDRAGSNRHFLAVNDLLIAVDTNGNRRVEFPADVRNGHWEGLIGKNASIYCKLREPLKNYTLCMRGTCLTPEKNFEFMHYCTLDSDQKYAIKFY